jgi:hypothetical protein
MSCATILERPSTVADVLAKPSLGKKIARVTPHHEHEARIQDSKFNEYTPESSNRFTNLNERNFNGSAGGGRSAARAL